MARYLSGGGSGGFEIVGSSGGMFMLLCLMIMSISIISMLLAGCADGYSDDRSNDVSGAGCGCCISTGGGDGGGCGGGCGGCGGCGG